MTGQPPFYSRSRDRLFAKILSAPIRYPDHLSIDACSLLQALLQRDPSKRLGSLGDAAALKAHPWFSAVDWKAVQDKRIPAPFRPQLNSEDDLQNFDTEFTESKIDDELMALSPIEHDTHHNGVPTLAESCANTATTTAGATAGATAAPAASTAGASTAMTTPDPAAAAPKPRSFLSLVQSWFSSPTTSASPPPQPAVSGATADFAAFTFVSSPSQVSTLHQALHSSTPSTSQCTTPLSVSLTCSPEMRTPLPCSPFSTSPTMSTPASASPAKSGVSTMDISKLTIAEGIELDSPHASAVSSDPQQLINEIDFPSLQ